jgi:hypothetical protein
MTEQPENRLESAQEALRPEVLKSPDFKMAYVNNVSLHASAWDMHLTFGELYQDISGGNVLEQRVTIALSLQVAKVLAAIVGNAVANYEAQIGEIKVPPELEITTQVPQQKSEEPSA